MLHCTLCRDVARPGEVTHCECGTVLHEECLSDHQKVCPSAGDEPWIGLAER